MSYYVIQARTDSGTHSTNPVELSIGDAGTNEFETRADAENFASEMQLEDVTVLELDEADHPRSGRVG